MDKKDLDLSQKKTLTPLEVAEYCGFGVSNTYKLLHEGRIPCIKIGKRFYIPRSALDRWLEAGGKFEE